MTMKHIMNILISVFSFGYHVKNIDFVKNTANIMVPLLLISSTKENGTIQLEDELLSTVIQFIYKEAQRSGKLAYCIVDDTISSKSKVKIKIVHEIVDELSISPVASYFLYDSWQWELLCLSV